MFRDRSFNIAVAISLGWHLFWISAVTIVITPTKLDLHAFPSISFLGPILEEGSFRIGFEGMDSRAEKIEYHRRAFGPGVAKEPLLSHPDIIKNEKRNFPRIAPEAYFPFIRPDGAAGGGRRLAGSSRAVKTAVSSNEERVPLLLEGPLASRKVIYRPRPPRYPGLLYEFDMDFDMRMRLRVDSGGRVIGVEKLNSSGNIRIDVITLRYVRRWLFESSGERPVDEGILSFKPIFR